MTRIFQPQIRKLLLVVFLSSLPCLATPQKKTVPAAPVPPQILDAKTIFISNAGSDCTGFSGGPDEAYNRFYAAMESWARYGLASAPANADLDIEISFVCTVAPVSVFKGDSGPPAYLSHLKLVILDIKTHVVLWVITEHVPAAILQGSRDKNFDRGMDDLVEDVKRLVGTK